MNQKISFVPGVHNNKDVIFIKFDYDKHLIERVKQLPGAKWSRQNNAWYVTDNDYFRTKFNLPPRQTGKRMLMKIHPANQQALQQLIDHLELKKYSLNTLKTYRNEFAQLLYAIEDKNVNDLNVDDIKGYMLYCIRDLKITENQLNSRFNAIKFYFEQVLKRQKIFIEIPRPKKPSQLPKVINANDIKKMLEVTTNLKHNTMLKLCYGMGLRVSEVANLKLTDIDSKNMQVLVERAKGKKDRYVNLPESVLEQLRSYFKTYKPKEYLFEGQHGGPYSLRSIQKVFKDAMKKARINKPVGIHSLRHSFATHLLENGTDISHIQKLLGHNDIKTTLIYAQVGKKDLKKVKSPLDML